MTTSLPGQEIYPAFEKATSESSIDSNADFDSGWQLANNFSNHMVAIDHNLAAIPSQVTILFSPDKQTVYPLNWSWGANSAGNPVTISMNDTSVDLAIFAGAALHGVWNPANAQWTMYTQGYFRVFANR